MSSMRILATLSVRNEAPYLHQCLSSHRIDAKGYQAINFEEFVFLPTNGTVDYQGRNYLEEMKYYYCHRPKGRKLVRAFKNGLLATLPKDGVKIEWA